MIDFSAKKKEKKHQCKPFQMKGLQIGFLLMVSSRPYSITIIIQNYLNFTTILK